MNSALRWNYRDRWVVSKNGCLSTKKSNGHISPTIYARWKALDSRMSWRVVLFFYLFCRPVRFLDLLEMEAVFSMNNNDVSRLSVLMCQAWSWALDQPQFTASNFEVLRDVFSLSVSTLSSHAQKHYYSSLWFQPLWNCLNLTGTTRSILQVDKPDLRWAQPAESRKDSNLDPSLNPSCCLTHRPRPLPCREGGRHSRF